MGNNGERSDRGVESGVTSAQDPEYYHPRKNVIVDSIHVNTIYNTSEHPSNPQPKIGIDVKVGDEVKKILFGAKGYEYYAGGRLDGKQSKYHSQT